jgi:hypothetical protein
VSIVADHVKASRRAFQSALYAVDQLAEAMADAESPNGEAAYHMHATHARQALLEAVSALDNRLRRVTLPVLPTLQSTLRDLADRS